MELMDFVVFIPLICLGIVLVILGIILIKGSIAFIKWCQKKRCQKLKTEEQEMAPELQAAKEKFRAARQRFEDVAAACPTPLPIWAERKAVQLRFGIGDGLDIAKQRLHNASSSAVCYDNFDFARVHLKDFEWELDSVRKNVYRLAGIQKWVMRFRRKAQWKAEATMVLADQVQKLAQRMSDQGIALNGPLFDTLQASADALSADVATNGEGIADRSEQIFDRSEKLFAHAESTKQLLEDLAAVRAYVPKLIAEHEDRPSELLGRNSGAIGVLERIKSFSASHVWYDLDRRLKDIPGTLSRARSSFSLASEMYASQSWFAAKKEAEAAVALADEVENILDEIAVLDARIAEAQEKVIKTFGEVKIVVTSAVRMVEDREEVSVVAKQLAVRALSAFERASYLISDSDTFDHLGALESLIYARQFADAALDRAKEDVLLANPPRVFGGCGIIED